MFKYDHIIFIILFFFTTSKLYAEDIGKVYSLENPDSHIIYFGPCLQNDTSIMNFVLQSYMPDTTFEIKSSNPTFLLGLSPNSSTADDHLSFFCGTYIYSINNFPFILNKNKLTDTIKIPFTAWSSEPNGRREGMLIIGFLYPNDNTSKVPLYSDTFFLIGKNTSKYIDGYDDYVKFDSVFIGQTIPINRKFKVKNTYIQNIDAISQEWNLISKQYTDAEFFIENKSYPLTFYQGKAFHEWNIEYNPKDIIPDTAEFRIIFKPDEINEPNKLDTVKVWLYGVGVTQSFNVVRNSDCEISSNTDTIDIGYIRVGSTKTASITLRNVGNVNYKLIKQNIYDEVNDTPISYFHIEHPFCENKSVMKVNDVDSFSISFMPDKKGAFIARYVLENDFKSRKILSNNITDYKKTIIIKGVGVEPILQLEKDSIDFGNVNYANANTDCLTEKDTIITLFNVGNSELIVYDIESDNPVFQASPTSISIPANSSKQIKITFISNPPEGLRTGTITFNTNENKLVNHTILLLGKSIPPISGLLSIPHLSVKPGTILEVPINLVSASNNSSISQYASNYSIYLNYNPALLSYLNRIKIGTASESCDYVNVNEFGNGNLEINVSKQFSTLDSNTTLLKLQFKTFMGDAPTTEIAINNAKIGINEVCDDYIKLNLMNGSYSIDSICGLDYKLNNIGKNKYDYQLTENDLGNIYINFTLPFAIEAQFSICNYLGDELLTENYLLPQGTYSKTILLNKLNVGIYYTTFHAGLYYKVIPFIKK